MFNFKNKNNYQLLNTKNNNVNLINKKIKKLKKIIVIKNVKLKIKLSNVIF